MKKKTIIIVVLTAVTALILFIASRPTKKTETNFETAEVKKGSITNTITATGTIEPIKQVEVGTQVSGIISKIYVDYNSEVKKGQVIAELEKTLLESELASQKANLASARNEFQYQEKNYKRTAGLYEKKLVSDTEYETALYQYQKTKSTYEKAQADIIKSETNLGYAIIYSPIDGVVLSRAVEEGQTVASSFNTPTLFTIAKDLKQMQVIANVDEADIGQVKEGQKVIFTVDAFPYDSFEGAVTQVRLQPTTTSNVVTYEVVIEAPNPDMKLKPGLTANIMVYTLEENNILVVPTKALRFVPADEQANTNKNEKSVWIKNAVGLTRVPVKVGASNSLYTEIKEGLQEGSQIIVGIQQNGQMTKATESTSESDNNPFMPKRPKR